MTHGQLSSPGSIATVRFRVVSHFAVTNHGAFIAGVIAGGTIRLGDTVTAPALGDLTIDAIESADNLQTRESLVCLRFSERPARADLEAAFPVGSVLVVESVS